jgi:hypothetical protein
MDITTALTLYLAVVSTHTTRKDLKILNVAIREILCYLLLFPTINNEKSLVSLSALTS